MIALEMSGEIEPPSPSPPPSVASQLLVDDDGRIRCPRCTFQAFVPIADREVVCVGCPDNQWYALPAGVDIGPTSLYRCDSCGARRPVTMTLSEVNLHCVYKKLTLHVKQIDENEVRRVLRQPRMEPEQFNRLWRDYTSPVPPKWNFKSTMNWAVSNDAFNPFTAADEALLDLSSRVSPETSFFVDDRQYLSRRVSPETRENTRALERVVTERMRVALDLTDFDVFAKTRRELNAAVVIRGEYVGNDLARRTGRTTRGLLEVIAKCSLERWDEIWVRGGSERHDKELRYRAEEMIGALKLDYPSNVRIKTVAAPRPTEVAGIYFDHTFYEQRAQSLSANGDDTD